MVAKKLMKMAGSKCFLDTNIIILILNGDNSLASQLDNYSVVNVSSITAGELYFGAYASTNKEKNLSRIRKIFELCTPVYPDDATSVIYGQIKAALKKKGRPIPDNDIWIAAIAIQHKTALITRDAHFNHIEGLKMSKW